MPGTGEENQVWLSYDKTTDKCTPFVYKGEGGNENRFRNDRECMGNCSLRGPQLYPSDATETCKLKKEFGDCFSHYLLWYYDAAHIKCISFYYSGCGGNGNRFRTQQDCNTTCMDEEDAPEEFEADTPAGLIIGIVLGILGAIILIVAIVLRVKTSKTKSGKKTANDTDAPLQDVGIEMK
ncbi:BPTI/Kunitz domain-containing protein [Megalops cyprinoides]|uniref:BPTI/Kunitz domain-containing protein n=1 Tax=Megalops cyprinoides TaxID=118141 RepID=UPI001864B1C0|nr:BPTI/Kunitz domain-containing protein [Megalops cyprinoides]